MQLDPGTSRTTPAPLNRASERLRMTTSRGRNSVEPRRHLHGAWIGWLCGLLACVLSAAPVAAQDATAQATSAPGSVSLDADEVPSFVRELVAGGEVVYASDYLSFVGRDAQGHVAFALDNNRGRDGAEYQAEHFLVLHDEQRGWIDVPGYGPYPNPDGVLVEIPDSPFFEFSGSVREGLRVEGRQSPLLLEIEPLEPSVIRARPGSTLFAMASAAATLRWDGRVISGRVIHEQLVFRGQNRLTRFDWSFLVKSSSFQGLYMTTPESDDLYLHRVKGSFGALGTVLGLQRQDGSTREPQEIELEELGSSQAWGLFRWPTEWEASWIDPERGPTRLRIETVDLHCVQSRLLGGFAMGIVRGELEQGPTRTPIYGFSELIEWLD